MEDDKKSLLGDVIYNRCQAGGTPRELLVKRSKYLKGKGCSITDVDKLIEICGLKVGTAATKYNCKNETCKPSKIVLKDYQIDAVERFAVRCRHQKGEILVHSMGSGKTFTSLYLLQNFRKDKHWIIVTPKGLEGEWKNEFKTFFGVDHDPKKVEFTNYKEIYSMMYSDGHALIKLFEDKYVVCDEAHKLLRLLRSQPQQSEEDEDIGNVRPLDRAFAAAYKIILVTGTPLQTNWGDLSLLVNLVAGSIIMPGLDSMFLQQFALKIGWAQRILSYGGFGANIIAPATVAYQTLTKAILSALSYINWQGAFYNLLTVANQTLLNYDKEISLAVIVLGFVSYLNTTFNAIAVDADAVAKVIAPYISWYNFADDSKNLGSIPKNTVEKVPFKYTDFQIQQHLKLAYDCGTSTMTELKLMSRIAESDVVGASLTNVNAREDFIRLGRVIGNLSEDCLKYSTVRVEDGPFKGSYMAHNPLGQGVTDSPYACPKYIDAYLRMVELRKTSKRLPVAYSCFDKYGFQTFSAFLYGQKVKHIVIHPNDDEKVRRVLMELAKEEHDLFNSADDELQADTSILCVLIHPTLTEGLSFTLNPELIALEIPLGYGVQEQVYARIIRTLPGSEVKKNGYNKDYRLQKKTTQYIASMTDVTIPLTFFGLADFRLDFVNTGIGAVLSAFNLFTIEKKKPTLKQKIPSIASPLGQEFFIGRMYSKFKKLAETDYEITVHKKVKLFWNFINESRNSKAVKDAYTEYMEAYKFSALTTADQLADDNNITQAQMMLKLGNAMKKYKDIKNLDGLDPSLAISSDVESSCSIPNIPPSDCTIDQCIDPVNPEVCHNKLN